jgi:DNA transformation protein
MLAPMAGRSDPYLEHCLELLAPLGAVRARRMFGGCGIYIDELFVALIAADMLYLKTDAQTRDRFEAAGCRPFVYSAKTGETTMSYFTVPDDAMESIHAMGPWARLAIAAALRARATRPAPRRRRKA